jgi:hypothetical protein
VSKERPILPAEVRAGSLIEKIHEDLDEKYGDPCGEMPFIATPEMLAAEDALVRAVISGYTPWACDQTHKALVDVAVWIQAHRPDWSKVSDGAAREATGT